MGMKFNQNDLVWTKFCNYPWGPSRIASQETTQKLKDYYNRDGVGVLFLGKPLYFGLVDEKNIKLYKEREIEPVIEYADEYKEALEMVDLNIEEPALELKKRRRSYKNKAETLEEKKRVKQDTNKTEELNKNKNKDETKETDENKEEVKKVY